MKIHFYLLYLRFHQHTRSSHSALGIDRDKIRRRATFQVISHLLFFVFVRSLAHLPDLNFRECFSVFFSPSLSPQEITHPFEKTLIKVSCSPETACQLWLLIRDSIIHFDQTLREKSPWWASEPRRKFHSTQNSTLHNFPMKSSLPPPIKCMRLFPDWSWSNFFYLLCLSETIFGLRRHLITFWGKNNEFVSIVEKSFSRNETEKRHRQQEIDRSMSVIIQNQSHPKNVCALYVC